MIERNFGNFNPHEYLEEYYSKLDNENKSLLSFFATAYKDVPANSTLLEFGSGPTIYSLISASKKVKNIHVTDYLNENIKEIANWLEGKGFDWTNFIKKALICEKTIPTKKNIYERSAVLRKKIQLIGRCDAFNTRPLLQAEFDNYDIVASNFCAESITTDKVQWKLATKNIFSLLKTGGLGVISALEGAESYTVNNKLFPAVNISEFDLRSVLIEIGFDRFSLSTSKIEASENRGYKGIILLIGKKIK